MNRFLIIIIFLGFLSPTSFAQKKSSVITLNDSENAVFKNEWSIGARLHTNGLSAYFERVWIKSIWKKRVIQTNFFYYQDFKQKKVKSPYAEVFNTSGYFYGKQNNFWNVNALYGSKKVLGATWTTRGRSTFSVVIGRSCTVAAGAGRRLALLLVTTRRLSPRAAR